MLTLRVGVATGLIALLVSRMDWAQFQRIIGQHGLKLYLWLVPMAALSWLVYVGRWWLLLLPLKLTPPFHELILDSLVGLFYGLFIPTGLAGDAVRAARLGDRHHALQKTLLSVVLERLVGLLGLTLLLGIQLVNVNNDPIWGEVRLSWAGWGILITLAVTMTLIAGGGRALNRRLLGWVRQGEERCALLGRWPFNRLVRQADQLWALTREYAKARGLVALSIAGSVVYQLSVTLAYYIGGTMLGTHVRFGDYIWIVALVMLAQTLPITVAGLGVREGLFVFLLGQYGVSAATSVALSLVVFSVTLLFGALGGVLEVISAFKNPLKL